MLGARRQEEAEGGKKEAIRRQEGGNNGARRTQEGGNNVRALRGLCGALPGSVDTDLIPWFRFWAPELLVLTLFNEIMITCRMGGVRGIPGAQI